MSPVPSGQRQGGVEAVGWAEHVDDEWHPNPASGGTSSTKRRRTRPSEMTSIATRTRLRAAVFTTLEGFGEVQGDARDRDAVRVESIRVRSSSSWRNLRGVILVPAWTAHLTRTRALTTTCAVAAKRIHGSVTTSFRFEETATNDAPEVIFAAAAPTTSTFLLPQLRVNVVALNASGSVHFGHPEGRSEGS